MSYKQRIEKALTTDLEISKWVDDTNKVHKYILNLDKKTQIKELQSLRRDLTEIINKLSSDIE